MTNDQEPESFSLALREAAYDFEPPNHEQFHSQAVTRTRQIKRRRSAGGALAGVVAVGVAGALAVTVSGRPVGAVSAAADTPGHPAASSGESPPRPAPSGLRSVSSSGEANGGSLTESQVLQAFYAALPDGSGVSQTQNPEAGVTTPGATTPLVNSLTGYWYVTVDVSLRNSHGSGYSSVELVVTHGVGVGDCTTAEAGSTTDACIVDHVDSGTLILDESRHNASDPASAPIWNYYWISPAGYEVDLTIGADSVSDFALTQQQASGILTSSAWAPIAEALPAAVCVGGKLAQVYMTPDLTSALHFELRCSTDGELYPMS
jgi:hypothetical protein